MRSWNQINIPQKAVKMDEICEKDSKLLATFETNDSLLFTRLGELIVLRKSSING